MKHVLLVLEKYYEFSSSSYDARTAYGQSKLAQIWHTLLLQQRYGEQGINAYSLHPGMIYIA
jgi:NAD(P)-dependent dehydrogenase (short-subunit alcohol dehydrogenase family)